LKISQETPLDIAFYELLPFIVEQTRDSFALLSVKDVMLFQH
jgi:hypothetical protein